MNDRVTLREFQTRLAERLKSVASESGEASKLGFVAGGRHWLTGLDQVNEMVSVPTFSKAPWVRPWFLGAVGVRGVIYGCTDLAAYLGLGEATVQDENRLILAHARFGAHAALRIEQALGLRNTNAMRAVPPPDGEQAPWRLGGFEDSEGTLWTEISIEALLASPDFFLVSA